MNSGDSGRDRQDPGADKYWFNTRTRTVEKGKKSAWENRMGPYDTEEEARNALGTAAERTADWEADDWNA
ncbi:hypothetical protein [Brevibacterium litoralis]|uniref:hypothetical protein n=1 Tax=Brevibacterium litoralis TaxID=3138935 RepID=UPI0032EB9145